MNRSVGLGRLFIAVFRYVLLAFALVCAVPVAYAANDFITFKNGDRLTGEVKSLSRGQLKFKTDATGTINIEWDKVAYIDVAQGIQVETQSGVRYFGEIRKSEQEFKVLVVTSDGPAELNNNRVIAMNPIDQGGFKDVDLNISAGYNFAKASKVTQFNVGVDAKYRTQKRILSGNFSSLISDSDNNESSQRQTLGFNYTRLRPKRWLNDGGVTFERNDELGINLRTSLSAGGGRILVQSSNSSFILKGGLRATRENTVDNPEDTDSLESYATIDWEWFRFDKPELDWSTSFEVIPSLTETGRVRTQLDTTLRWEIINDFYWQLAYYNTYDNQPQSDTTSSNDYGITTSISYDF